MKEQILFYAFRYVLGRRTYAISDVADEILHYAEDLSQKTRTVMLKELDEAYRENRLGDQCDCDLWQKVRTKLDEIERKEKSKS